MASEGSDGPSFLEASHDFALWMIGLADTKASLLTAASAGLAGLLFLQSIPACNAGASYLLLVAVGLALSSTFCCLETVFPRTASKSHTSLLYYRTILKRTKPDYIRGVVGLSESSAEQELADEVWELARTQQSKYAWLRWAVVLFGASLVPAALGFVWAHLPCGG